MNCEKCGIEIPKIRLEAIPNTTTCVKCSDTERYRGYMLYAHKTAGECVFLDPSNKEAIRRADRANSRAR
jgi:hypothetical protein